MISTLLSKIILSPLVEILPTDIENESKLRIDGACVFIANHTSLLDAFVLAKHLPRDVVFVANTDIAKKYAFAMKGRNVLTVDSSKPYSVRAMLKALKVGKQLVVFPEGRITVTNALMKIYTGVAYLAIKTGVKLVPIGIDGGEKAKKFTYLEGKIPTRWFPRIHLYVGDPFELSDVSGETMRQRKEMGSHIIYRRLQETLLSCRLHAKRSEHLVELIREKVREAPEMVIAEDMSGKITMHKLWQKIMGLSYILSRAVNEPRLGILMPTSIAGMVSVLATLHAGMSPAMINSSMDAKTLCSCLRTGDIKTVVTSKTVVEKGKLQELIEGIKTYARVIYLEDLTSTKGFFKKLRHSSLELKVLLTQHQPVRSSASDIILYTSGSEGMPKGVVLTHDNVFANIQQVRLMVDFTSRDKVVNVLPIFHSFGLIVMFLSVLSHLPAYLVPSPLLYKAIPLITSNCNGTIFFGTSTFLSAYAKNADPGDFSRLRYVFSGAEKLQDSVREQWIEKFGVKIYEGYGLTETSPVLAIQTPLLYKRGSVGCLVPGVKHKIQPVEGIEEGGRLQIQAPNLTKGYLLYDKGFVKTPEWFDTGDIVTVDEKGFVTIQGRAKRFAKIGGEMVSLTAVEEHVKQAVPDGDVVAVRIMDERKGERIEIVATSSLVTKDRLREYWKDQKLSNLLMPSTVHIMDSIPILGSGKANVVKVTNDIQSLYSKKQINKI